MLTNSPETGACRTLSADDRARVQNAQPGSLTGLDCPICRNRGYVFKAVNGAVVACECRCMPKRRSIRRISESGLADLLEVMTFDRYETPEPWQKTAKAAAMDYAENGDGHWFMATGNPGTGKSHLCTAIAGALMDRGRDMRYMLWRGDSVRLKAMITDAGSYQEEMCRLKAVQVLYIDDFLKGKVTEADVNLAFELLSDRYNRRHAATIISSEKSVEEILDIDEALGSRIYERCKGYLVRTGRQNWRLRK